MNRQHDIGGRPAGPIPDKNDDVVFHRPWHAKALALNLACGALGAWNIDASRFARERLKDYSDLSYYEKWMAGLTTLLVERELLTEADLSGEVSPSGVSSKILRADNVKTALHKVTPYKKDEGPAPKFAIGQSVRTLSAPRPNHCRLPYYAADKCGTILLSHGNHVLPDSNALFDGEAPEPLYTVEFSAKTLWGQDAEASGDAMSVDLWQSYLEPA